MQEIERKFLVKNTSYKKEAFKATRIVQGFLNTHPERTVRVRIKGDKGYITVKGIPNAEGTTRFEWEREIPLADAESLLPLCEPGMIDKQRFEVRAGNHTFEIDEFAGDNTGLVVAEIELESEDEAFQKPEWLGQEVTGEPRYYNSNLIQNPFRNWRI